MLPHPFDSNTSNLASKSKIEKYMLPQLQIYDKATD